MNWMEESYDIVRRDLFAAFAMSGLLARIPFVHPEDVAADAVEAADYLIAELDKEPS